VRPYWNGRTSGGGWDGEEAARRGAGRAVVALHDVDDGDGGRDEHGGQDHQEDEEWDQHGFTFFSLRVDSVGCVVTLADSRSFSCPTTLLAFVMNEM
jgi:hypothetical protein